MWVVVYKYDFKNQVFLKYFLKNNRDTQILPNWRLYFKEQILLLCHQVDCKTSPSPLKTRLKP